MSGNLSETLAAGRIIDVMTGGKFDWRARLEDCDFLESGDWLTALAYARAALPTPDAGEVRTYREGVEAGARVADAMHDAWREQESRYRAAGNNGPYLGAPSYHDAAAAIRKLP